MKRNVPFLGETTDRSKAFPGIASVDLKIIQDVHSHYGARPREYHFTKDTVPRRIECANPRCQQGGLDLQQVILFSPPGRHTHWCNGHEGTPKGQRRGDPCDNRFEVSLSVTKTDDKPDA